MTRVTFLALFLVIFFLANSISASSTSCGECRHGTCVDNVCVCKAGFFGPTCASGTGICVEASQEGCVHGTCRDGECICNPGYFGDRCENKGCLNNCSFKGLCFEAADEPPRCLCMYGHYGADCSKSGCSKGCKHGQCVMSIHETIRCECEPGWAGEDCSIRVCSPCVHGACDGVECVCDPGYTGIDCSKRACPDCGDRGACDHVTGQCICKSPFFNRPGGLPDCSGNEAVCPGKCTSFRHGICLKDGCHCREGWSGFDCSEVSCPRDCNGNGKCNKGECMCEPGFSGPDCSQRTCPNNCNGNGLCVNGQCHCMKPFAASALLTLPNVNAAVNVRVNVTEAIANGAPIKTDGKDNVPSVSTGVADGFSNKVVAKFFPSLPVQEVEPGFGAADCSKLECATDCGESKGQGKCDTRVGVCMCNKGWYWNTQGQDCAAKICGNKCSNNGLCVNGSCRCLEGFTGPSCEMLVEKLDDKAQHSFLQLSTLEQQQADLAVTTERSARIQVARDAILAALHEADKAEALRAAQAVRADADAVRKIEDEHDAAIAAAFVDAFGSSSAAFVHVLSTSEGEAAARAALAEINHDFNGALSPTQIMLNRILQDTKKQYEYEMKAVKEVQNKVRSFNETLGQGCLANCSGRGICQGGICKCNNSFGKYCEQIACPKGCSGHGVCDTTTGKCSCFDGYGSNDCSEPSCNPHDCNKHGKCEMVSERNKFGVTLAVRPKCVCNAGWTGVNCDIKICDDKDCSNRGTCANGTCFCSPGFTGKNCEIGPLCNPACGPNGKCKAEYDGSAGSVSVACECDAGFTGPTCALKLCDPAKEAKCGEHGACIDDKCVCEPGWVGEFCSSRSDCGECSPEGGVCGENEFGQPTCKCNKGFGGPGCKSKVCDKDCNGRGQCLDGKCACTKGWSGDTCQEGCPNNCSGRGQCVESAKGEPRCECADPYYGRSCQFGRCPGATILADGSHGFCSGHGVCEKASGVCACDVGYTGEACNTFTVEACKNDCNTFCRVGSKGAFPIKDPVTGDMLMTNSAQCLKRCLTKCV